MTDALASLEAGDPPPPIGRIDVAERTLMAGRGRGRSISIGGGAGIGTVIVILLLLRFIPALIPRGAPERQGGPCNPPSCAVLTPADNGRTVVVDQGAQVTVSVPLSGPPQAGCFEDSDPAVLQLRQCTTTTGDSAVAGAVYVASSPGTATISGPGFSVTLEVH